MSPLRTSQLRASTARPRPASIAPRLPAPRAVRWLLAALAVGGCMPSRLDEYADTAPIRVHAAPEDYSIPQYGRVVATFHGSLGEGVGSRIVASAGAGSPIVFARAWDGGSVSEKAFQRCKRDAECIQGADLGATLIPFGTWGAALTTARHGCVYAPANGRDVTGAFAVPGGQAYVLCETHPKPQNFELGLAAVQGDDASLQFSGFGLPPGHPLGIALLGVHARENRTGLRRSGGLYHQPDRSNDVAGGVLPRLVPLIDPSTGKPFSEDANAGDFGRQVAGAANAQGELVIAIAQPARQRVIVATYDPRLAGELLEKFRVRACIAPSEPSLRGFGERALVADIDGDGAPELFLGSDPVDGAERGRQALFMYPGAGLPPPSEAQGACAGWGAAATAISCQDLAEASCADSAFGASLAVGDFDGDQRGDLLVGAPLATVAGVPGAGAAWIFPGGASGLDLARTTLIAEPSPRANAYFGASSAALRTHGRDEPVIGVPGRGKVLAFMCTPLEQGFGAADLCLPD